MGRSSRTRARVGGSGRGRMTHPLDHRPVWETPIDDRGHTTGDPTICVICGVEPSRVVCVNCGGVEDETVSSHGTLTRGLHSIRVMRGDV